MNEIIENLRLRCLNLDVIDYHDRLVIVELLRLINSLLTDNNLIPELLGIVHLISLNSEENLELIRRFYIIIAEKRNFFFGS